MPVVRIEALVRTPPDLGALLPAVAEVTGRALGVDPARCWASFHAVPSGAWYEGGRVRTVDDGAPVSPVVTIAAYTGRSLEQKAQALRGVAAAVGEALGCEPGAVFVEYREIPQGHVHTAGTVR